MLKPALIALGLPKPPPPIPAPRIIAGMTEDAAVRDETVDDVLAAAVPG